MEAIDCVLTEDELRAAIKAMIDELAHVNQGNWEWLMATADVEPRPHVTKSALQYAIDATHAARKRHPIEWPEVK